MGYFVLLSYTPVGYLSTVRKQYIAPVCKRPEPMQKRDRSNPDADLNGPDGTIRALRRCTVRLRRRSRRGACRSVRSDSWRRSIPQAAGILSGIIVIAVPVEQHDRVRLVDEPAVIAHVRKRRAVIRAVLGVARKRHGGQNRQVTLLCKLVERRRSCGFAKMDLAERICAGYGLRFSTISSSPSRISTPVCISRLAARSSAKRSGSAELSAR